MEKIAADLKKILPLKSTTTIGDIVIVAAKEPQMLTYAVVTNIERDDSRKHEWWHVTFQFLGVPLQKATWTLRTPQFTGEEVFTMGGAGRFIQAVELDTAKQDAPDPVKKPAPKPGIRRIK